LGIEWVLKYLVTFVAGICKQLFLENVISYIYAIIGVEGHLMWENIHTMDVKARLWNLFVVVGA
jgi:hypothetical protein